jgi:hypothetical protein
VTAVGTGTTSALAPGASRSRAKVACQPAGTGAVAAAWTGSGMSGSSASTAITGAKRARRARRGRAGPVEGEGEDGRGGTGINFAR